MQDIRNEIGEGVCLDRSSVDNTAINYTSDVSRAEGIEELIKYATNIKEETEEK